MKKQDENLNGLSERHVAAIIRRKMMSKDHGDKSKYCRKVKHKNSLFNKHGN